MTDRDSSLQEEDSVHECRRCDIEDRVKVIISRSHCSGQQRLHDASCQTLTTDSSTHGINHNDMNVSDIYLEAEAHQSQVISQRRNNI